MHVDNPSSVLFRVVQCSKRVSPAKIYHKMLLPRVVMDTGRVESINWRWSLRRVSYRDYTQRNYFVWKFQEFLYAIHSIFKWIDRSPHLSLIHISEPTRLG